MRKDGTTFWADGVMTAVRNGGGEVVAYVKVLHDVTPRFEAERAVEKLNRELSELNEGFSYSVSHDLRAPVRAVHGFSRLLREQYLDVLPEDGQALLAQVEENAIRMGELIDALRRLSRLQREPMQPGRVDVEALVRSCWIAVGDEYPGHETTLVVGSLGAVHADPQLLRQVWFILFDNAIKFSQKSTDPFVRVSSHTDGDQRVFDISDNGAGFDMRYQEKLFRVFQRLRGEDCAGVGIGLAIVQRLINRHGGRVWADGTPGQGARFSFSLPYDTAVADVR